MIISSLEVEDLKNRKQIKIIFTDKDNRVELDVNITYDNEHSKNIFNQYLILKICIGNQCIERKFKKIDAYKFLQLVKRKDDLKFYLPKIAQVILDQFKKNISIDIEDIYNLLTDLLEKLIDNKDISHCIRKFENKTQYSF